MSTQNSLPQASHAFHDLGLPTPEEMLAGFAKLGMKPARKTLGEGTECCILGLMACLSKQRQLPFIDRSHWVADFSVGNRSFGSVIDGWDDGSRYNTASKAAAHLAEVAFNHLAIEVKDEQL